MYSHSISHTLQYSNVYLSTYLTLLHYRWVLLWVLGCVTLLPAVRGSQEAGFTLARAHLLADPSTSSADVVVLTLQLHLMQPTPLVLIPPSRPRPHHHNVSFLACLSAHTQAKAWRLHMRGGTHRDTSFLCLV